jgi:hypothetical protein
MRMHFCARMRRRSFLTGVAAAAALSVLGCGGGGDAPEQVTTEPVKGGNRERLTGKAKTAKTVKPDSNKK